MPYLIVGNWKMYFTYAQAVAWARQHQEDLQSLVRETEHKLVLCPSYEAISDIYKIIKTTGVAIGGQDCAPHDRGAYTGQVSATSLKQIGCSYCIIGHSETRLYQHVDNKMVAHAAEQALKNGLTPIVCVGEHKDQYEAKETFHVIAEQLAPVLLMYKNYEGERLCIAYEPVWAIGTGKVPHNTYLHDVYEFIKSLFTEVGLQRTPLLLYGGSVDPQTIEQLCKVPQIEGFLIGRASTDFKTLKKIVKLV